MYTAVLAYVIAFMGLVMIGGGVWGLFYLRSGPRMRALRYYAMAIGMICVGFGLAGVAQALRLLLVLVERT